MDFELMVLVQSHPAPVAYNTDELESRRLPRENLVAMIIDRFSYLCNYPGPVEEPELQILTG
jgi:hypothetical protein